MRLSPASDGNNSKYVLEVVRLINNQRLLNCFPALNGRCTITSLCASRLVIHLQLNCRSAAEQGREPVAAPRGGDCCLLVLLVKKPRQARETYASQHCRKTYRTSQRNTAGGTYFRSLSPLSAGQVFNTLDIALLCERLCLSFLWDHKQLCFCFVLFF